MSNIQIDITRNGTTTLATANTICYENIDVNVNVGTDLIDINTTEIADGQYANQELSQVYFPNVTTIGARAFQQADDFSEISTSLKYVDFPKVTTIEQRAFASCNGLKEVNFPQLQKLGERSFDESGLHKADLGEVTEIGMDCFIYSNLNICILRNKYQICSLANRGAFEGTPIYTGIGKIYVPETLVSRYKDATNWSYFANVIKPLSELEG